MNYHRWTLDEESVFREAIVRFKFNWSRIQQSLLPHISVKSMKNKYYQKMHNNTKVRSIKSQAEESSSKMSEEQVYQMIKDIISQNQL
ncbi:Myb-like_DNA-binding domain-containing protein [Hexamita inflata]|uniref:Myb-like DNA-binding domain-containing protein n=1 Tax=Hexamita inflata TaxID=28002 RepID=A0AA86PVP8_9EUKA|nr:Myb-like DNA-binding domain-containing protein [Hexamita inflata]